MKRTSSTSSRDPKVITAVEFLNDVWDSGHEEEVLRKYLLTRRELTPAQIDEAFRIHHIRLRGSAERPEVAKDNNSSKGLTGLSFLFEEKREEGGRLMTEFYKTEFNYIGVLRCLQDDYYKQLCSMSDENKIDLSRSELKSIFHPAASLLDFHKIFYHNVSQDSDQIGEVFVRLFNNFKQYVDYMKGCITIILKMRELIHDKKLNSCLTKIRARSTRKNDDWVDLLLVPLDRIMDYQKFLDDLYRWADKAKPSYTVLGKAARRIGRIADYIKKYKGGISNKNEMNKVQQFLGSQVNILAPKRLIIRRGPMFRRTTGWAARRKHYIFFLFSDLLVWTSKKGELQNLVRLRDCHVTASDSKTNPEKKFKIISSGKNKVHKVLLLECNLKQQRDDWFTSVQQEIESAKKIKWYENMTNDEKDFVKFLKSNPTTTPPGSANTMKEAKVEEDAFPPTSGEDNISPNDFVERYETSAVFPKSVFHEEVSTMEDTISVSEDLEPYSSYDKYGASMDCLFPTMVNVRSKQRDTKETQKTSTDGSSSRKERRMISTPGERESPLNSQLSSVGSFSSLSKIRRTDEMVSSKRPVIRLQSSSAFTLCLNDCD